MLLLWEAPFIFFLIPFFSLLGYRNLLITKGGEFKFLNNNSKTLAQTKMKFWKSVYTLDMFLKQEAPFI